MNAQTDSYHGIAKAALSTEPEVSLSSEPGRTVLAVRPGADNELIGASVRSALAGNEGTDLVVVAEDYQASSTKR
jgi:hypothetical protein|tara:strand:+ start:215 stop:439 length:225 start_codon:yes stop_codon:yes gene_type:complete